jgi:hypothetical protein
VKKLLLIGSIILVLGLLMAGFNTPIFANDPGDGGATPVDEGTWEAMHEACESGDWEAMTEAAGEAHGEDPGDMPCHDEDGYTSSRWGGMGGHMGGGMMSW